MELIPMRRKFGKEEKVLLGEIGIGTGNRGERWRDRNFTLSALALETYHPAKENRLSVSQGALDGAKTGSGGLKDPLQKEGPTGLSPNLVSAGLLTHLFVIVPLFGDPAYLCCFRVWLLTLYSPGPYAVLSEHCSPARHHFPNHSCVPAS